MGGGNLSPRQQMVGMMYLVLLAMLAMNASKSLLNAFVLLEDGINETVKSFNTNNYNYYQAIDRAAASSPAFQPTQEKAYKLKDLADKAFKIIADQKVYLWSGGALTSADDTVGGAMKPFLDDQGIPLNKDNQDFGASFYTVIDGAKAADDLEGAIKAVKELALEMLEEEDKEGTKELVSSYAYLLDTEPRTDPIAPSDPPMRFSYRISSHMPLAAVTANLSLYQSYIRNLEAEVISLLAAKMGGEGIVVDKSEGMASFESGYVLKNDSVFGKVFVSAYNSKITPEIYLCQPDTKAFNAAKGGVIKFAPGQKHDMPVIGEVTPLPVSGGKGQFRVKATELGVQTLQGIIKQVSPKGTDYIAFTQDYMVAEPSATVAATGMNMFYIGIDNPVKIAASGVSAEDLKITTTGGLQLSPVNLKKGEYKIKATKTASSKKPAKIIVAKKDGTKLGEQDFRVMNLPKPTPQIMGVSSGLISRGKLKAATFVKAALENFAFDLRIDVVSYKVVIKAKGDLIPISSPNKKVEGKVKQAFERAKPGDKIWIEDIKVKMPNGKIEKLPSTISLTVK